MKTFLLFLAAIILLGCAQDLRADGFDFSYTAGSTSGTGTLDATLISGDTYLVTSLMGTQTSSNPSLNGSLSLLGTGLYGDNDNEVNTSSPFLDVHGLGLLLGGSVQENIYNNNLSEVLFCNFIDESTCHAGQGAVATFTLTPVPSPEPGTLMLLATGFLGLAVRLRRKMSAQS